MNNIADFRNVLTGTEKKWLISLFNKIKQEFAGHPLPSHDHTHHLRVWFFARELLTALSQAGYNIDKSLVEKVMISVFFHDAGMTVTRKPSHGYESRLICEKYFRLEGGIEMPLLSEILDAIEMHDDKQYAEKMQGVNTHTILNVADDLDAYGAIGVYRYYEICLLRGINKKEIPVKVIENIKTRFGYLERIFGFLNSFVQKHEARKQLAINYFEQFMKKEPSAGQSRMDIFFELLNRLMKKACQYQSGLDFLCENDSGLFTENQDLQPYIRVLKEELQLFQY